MSRRSHVKSGLLGLAAIGLYLAFAGGLVLAFWPLVGDIALVIGIVGPPFAVMVGVSCVVTGEGLREWWAGRR